MSKKLIEESLRLLNEVKGDLSDDVQESPPCVLFNGEQDGKSSSKTLAGNLPIHIATK